MNKKIRKDKNPENTQQDGISRRDAIRRMGYAAFASSTMFLLLNNPTKVHAQTSPDPENPGDPGGLPGGGGGGFGDYDWD